MFCKTKIHSALKTFAPQVQIRLKKTFPPSRKISIKYENLRREKGLTGDPYAAKELLETPDYVFLDGRITPLGRGQQKRMMQNENAKQKIITLTKEIDFAVERHKQLLLAEEKQKLDILDRKLKPKGSALLNRN
ncbi:hypothetical protein ABEB36_001429 [Hypothenemus hampei]|uniref:Large ribosomal subunit protein mL52 n=1 Tax=Hypothenemus hampei TaxID=57062 RepID=A0ABD1FEI7_HYPHA